MAESDQPKTPRRVKDALSAWALDMWTRTGVMEGTWQFQCAAAPNYLLTLNRGKPGSYTLHTIKKPGGKIASEHFSAASDEEAFARARERGREAVAHDPAKEWEHLYFSGHMEVLCCVEKGHKFLLSIDDDPNGLKALMLDNDRDAWEERFGLHEMDRDKILLVAKAVKDKIASQVREAREDARTILKRLVGDKVKAQSAWEHTADMPDRQLFRYVPDSRYIMVIDHGGDSPEIRLVFGQDAVWGVHLRYGEDLVSQAKDVAFKEVTRRSAAGEDMDEVAEGRVKDWLGNLDNKLQVILNSERPLKEVWPKGTKVRALTHQPFGRYKAGDVGTIQAFIGVAPSKRWENLYLVHFGYFDTFYMTSDDLEVVP